MVRGTTLRKVIPMLRQAGAREVHMRIAAPPTTNSCFYGIDTPTREELLASSHSVEEIRRYMTADSLGYLSWDGLYSFQEGARGFLRRVLHREVSDRDSGQSRAASVAPVRSRRRRPLLNGPLTRRCVRSLACHSARMKRRRAFAAALE